MNGNFWKVVMTMRAPPASERLGEPLGSIGSSTMSGSAVYAPFFHASLGRPSIPIETYLRLMFLKYRYRLGFETLCREVTDSITWQRFCRIPHPTTLMKITTRCGQAAISDLNEARLAKAVEAKVLKTNRLRADTTVVEANVAYPSDSSLLAKGWRGWPARSPD